MAYNNYLYILVEFLIFFSLVMLHVFVSCEDVLTKSLFEIMNLFCVVVPHSQTFSRNGGFKKNNLRWLFFLNQSLLPGWIFPPEQN